MRIVKGSCVDCGNAAHECECNQREPFIRAHGDTLCTCGKPYRKHPDAPDLGWSGDGTFRPFLKVLCDGTKVKL